MTARILLAAALGLGLGATALAQSHDGHGPATKATKQAAAAPSTKLFRDVNAKMHKGMDIRFTGDADVDFVAGMIPHHQGAIDMANVVLKHGKDAEVRKLATDIIKAQEGEIAWMKAWLAKNAKK